MAGENAVAAAAVPAAAAAAAESEILAREVSLRPVVEILET